MQLIWTDYLLITISLVCLITDLRTRKILNIITFPGILAGIILNIFLSGWITGGIFALKGLVLGILIFWIPFAMGGLGAGDLKLLGVIGAFKGLNFTLYAGLYTAIAGGFISIIIIIFDKAKRQKTFGFISRYLVARTHGLEFKHEEEKSQYYFPYSTAIILGLAVAYLLH